MQDTKLFETILGIPTPWHVARVELKPEDERGCRENIIGDTHGVIPFRRVLPDAFLPSDAPRSSR